MSTKLRIYVAGGSKERERVQVAMDAVRALGLEITCDWLAAIAAEGIANEGLDEAKRRRYAVADYDGVFRADIIWVLAPNAHSTGSWAELGYAQGLRSDQVILVSGLARHRCIFASLATQEFDTDESALLYLTGLAERIIPRPPSGVFVGIPTLSEAGAFRTSTLAGILPRSWRLGVIDNGGHAKAFGLPVIGSRPSVAASWNLAIDTAEKDRCLLTVLLNDDVVVTREGLLELALEAELSYRRFRRGAGSLELIGAEPHAFAAFALNPAVTQVVGRFDEQFVPAYYEDTDYQKRLHLAGGRVRQVAIGLTHVPATTSRDLGTTWEKTSAASKALYQKKWGPRGLWTQPYNRKPA